MSHFKHLFMSVLVLRRSGCRAIRLYVYNRYVQCKNFWFQVLCVYGTHPSLYIRQKINYKDLKSNPSIRWANSVWQKYAMKYCIESMNIKEEWSSILAGCATLNDRVVFVSVLRVFIAKHEQEETAVLIDRRFHFVSKQYCIFLTEFPVS